MFTSYQLVKHGFRNRPPRHGGAVRRLARHTCSYAHGRLQLVGSGGLGVLRVLFSGLKRGELGDNSSVISHDFSRFLMSKSDYDIWMAQHPKNAWNVAWFWIFLMNHINIFMYM